MLALHAGRRVLHVLEDQLGRGFVQGGDAYPRNRRWARWLQVMEASWGSLCFRRHPSPQPQVRSAAELLRDRRCTRSLQIVEPRLL